MTLRSRDSYLKLGSFGIYEPHSIVYLHLPREYLLGYHHLLHMKVLEISAANHSSPEPGLGQTQMLQRVTSYLSPSIFIAYFSGLRLFGFSVRFPLYLFWFPINNVCKDKISDELFTFQASKLFQNSNEMLLVYLCAI